MKFARLMLCLMGALILFFLSSDVLGGELLFVKAAARDSAAGEESIYDFTFTTSDTGNGTDVGVPRDGRIVMIFPTGFNVSLAEIAVLSFPGGSAGGFSPITTSGDTIFLERDSTGAAIGDSVEVKISIVNIGNHLMAGSYTVAIETQRNDSTLIDYGISAPFSIIHGELHHFTFDLIGNQIVSNPFVINIYARDAQENIVASFTSTAGLRDETNSLTPSTTTNFLSGTWTGAVTITKTKTDNKITVTASGKASESNNFNVNPGPVHHFTFSNISSPKTAGTPFNITIIAKDVNDNIVTDFAQSVTLTDNTGTLSRSSSDNFSNGQWTGNVFITKKQNDVIITATKNGATGQSNNFNVQSASLDHFSISTITDKMAGVPFLITVKALDEYNNVVDSFTGTVNITDLTTTISPTVSTNFTNGQWSNDVTITKTQTNDIITVTRTSGGSQTGSSNGFNVNAGSLDHFDINPIASQIAGAPFGMTIFAKDVNGNTITSFTETAGLSDQTGTISPTVTGSFINGRWDGTNVKITKTKSGNKITATSSGKSSASNSFDVVAGALHHFRFEEINSPQVSRQQFTITVTAEDEFNNPRTQFNQTVNLTDDTGTLEPGTSGNFSSGQWTGPVTITKAQYDVIIRASRSGITGQSNKFNVTHSVLDHFVISPISTQAVGEPFVITITAQDYDSNRVENFAGTVTIGDLSGNISPTISTNFTNGTWSGNVTISGTYSSDRITVVRSGGSESGASNNFDVVAGEVHHFTISNITSPKTAGIAFEVTITAVDESNAKVNGFTGTVSLTDYTGSISPKTTSNFTAGEWKGNVTILKSYTGDVITASGIGRSGNSNSFDIQANNVDHFVINTIPSPQTAGQNFNITITAKDQNENTVTSFTQPVQLSDNTNTISPTTSGNFTSGVRTESVKITDAEANIQITATYGSATGVSNIFNVNAGALHHFSISTISTQQAGVPFAITVKAEDEFNNLRTAYGGTVDISDLTNTITPTRSGNFSNGQWADNVKITQTRTNDQISVKNTTGTETGNSNYFNVISSSVDHFVFETIGSPRVAGVEFAVTITAKDGQNNTVTSFNGTGILSDETGTISPTETGSFTNGVWTNTVKITKSWTGNSITITSSGKAGTSNDFNVTHANLDHFTFTTVTSPQTAGIGINVTIDAEDVYKNRVTSFSDYVNLSDNTGTINPSQTPNFSSGSWSGSVSITKSAADVIITASRFGSSGETNKFNIVAGSLNRFTIDAIGTQAAGEPFPITITAQDAFGNTRTQFTGTVDISDLTGQISPMVSGNFIQGKWTGNVVITQAKENDQITVRRTGGTESGTSVFFDVISSTVDRFVFDIINSPQEAGVLFNVKITAKDAQNNTVVNFNGTGVLTDKTGTIDPTETSSFSGGVWSGMVRIRKSWLGNTITITSSGKAGTSNEFDVNHTALDHFRFETVGSPQEAGKNFNVTIHAEDFYNNIVKSFNTYVNLSDNTGTISPTQSQNFVSGNWTGPVNITRSANDVIIYANRDGKSGESNRFNVTAAPLHHFTLAPISTQAAGEPFALSVTAKDVHENVRTQFTGTVDISVLKGSITPTRSSNFTQGQWTGNVVIGQADVNNQITVTRTGGTESGSSNLFDVISSTVDHFIFDNITSPQEAGVSFNVKITAKDAQHNTVTDFNGTGVLSDETGSISLKETGSFSGGVWTGNLTIEKSWSGNTITITSSGKAGTSNEFEVTHTDLDHFKFDTINSPQTAGSSFLIRIIAEDRFKNKVTSFNTYVTLTEGTGTISPATTPNFTSGEWSGLVTITRSQSDVSITATSSGKTGQSNIFNVVAGALNSFSVSSISTQAAGEPFQITVTALDANTNVVKSFSGTVDISDLTGTIDPTISDNFTEGKWTGNVTITQVKANNQITATRTGGTQTGKSNYFNVISSSVDRFVISNITSPKIAGQNFSITITAKDKDNNTVDSFTGTATLSDVTNTINPKTTANFTNGVWSGEVQITTSWVDNVITVTSSGKAGYSNNFTVIHSSLDHFKFASIYSPQTAGNAFTITITAEDQFNNKVTSYSGTVTLTDETGTISPSVSGNFTGGVWSAPVTITKSQNDVEITASGSGKQGTSTSFNVIANQLHRFFIDNITTQATGKPFALSVTAQDSYNNVAASFTGKVNITDLTNTISPTISNNFASGKWTGNVTIHQVRDDNRITVTQSGGTKTGQSNLFDVISSNVDHFVISNVTTPQVAGQSFQITITAQDADNNTATSFNGTVSLADVTATLTPTTTTNFSNGVWTGNVKIIKAKVADKITATALGKAGVSNEFNVIHAALDHFVIEPIPSPQVAGNPFLMKITAKDSMENTVSNFNSYVDLTDNTMTISPTQTSNFTNGQWFNNVTITKSHPNVMITASRLGKTGVSNSFYVKPNQVKYIKVTDAAGGKGLEIGDRTLSLDEKLRLYATGFDHYNNYVRDVTATWGVTGTLDQPLPLTGKSTLFDPKTPGTSGKIYADSLSLISDSTGTLTIGAMSYVKILTTTGGAGLELADTTITADDTLTLHCAGYDAGNNYVGDVVVNWVSTGDLLPVVSDSSAWIKFNPTKAPASGQIIVMHPVATGDVTGTIRVVPGRPVSDIVLVAEPPVLPADGTSLSSITSNVIYDADSNPVAKNTPFTVHTDLGTITSPDISPIYQGIQIAASDSGKISFVLQAPTTGGLARISVSSPEGSATGFVNVIIASLNIISVNSIKSTVSQGQKAAPVTMTVENLGTATITNLDAGLTFTGYGKLKDNRNDEFVVKRTDAVTEIPGGATRILTFGVNVSIAATLDTVIINGGLWGQMEGVTVGIDSAQITDTWIVQSPANLRIKRVTSLVDTVSQGQENILVSMAVENLGRASANVVQDTLRFIDLDSLSLDITPEFIIFPFTNNPQIIKGNSTESFNFKVHVTPYATTGNVGVDGRIIAKDANSDSAVSDSSADDSTHAWFIKLKPIVRIKSLLASQQHVSLGQQVPWYVTMKVANDGGTAIKLDSVRTKFISLGNNITNEFDVTYGTTFMASGTNLLAGNSEDSIRITINKTSATTLGKITITGSFYFMDIGTGKHSADQTNTGIEIHQPAQLFITKVIPSQLEATRNQGQDWFVYVVLENKGGTDIEIKTDISNIVFSTGAFAIKKPNSLNSGGLILSPGKIDTLTFTIDGTGWETGRSYIDAVIAGIELTTGTTIEATSRQGASVLIEQPANVRIYSVQISETPNGTTVNTNQQIKFNVTLENIGEDSIKRAIVSLRSNGSSIDSVLYQTYLVGGGKKATKSFILTAASAPRIAERFLAQIDSAFAENTREPAGVSRSRSIDSTETITIQTPAKLRILDIIVPSTIRADQVEQWFIKVVVTDSGQADVELNLLSSKGVFIEKGGEEQTDYRILPPDSLQGGGLILHGGAIDTLIYTVTVTGKVSGLSNVIAHLNGFDVNTQNQLSTYTSRGINILTSAAVKLISTEVSALNYDPANRRRGLVNKGQSFQIKSIIENRGRVRIDSVLVQLSADGNSIIAQDKILINHIDYESSDSVVFNITANNNFSENELLERFTVDILKAIDPNTGQPASIDDQTNNSTSIKIQAPAQLAVEAYTATGDTIFTTNQEFVVKAIVNNLGAADVYDSGNLTIFIPDNYRIISGTDTLTESDVASFAKGDTIKWNILTPSSASESDTIHVSITKPLKDMNNQLSAQVVKSSDKLVIQTSSTNLIWHSEISAPAGATDGVLSTVQDFTISSTVQFSKNLKNVSAVLTLPPDAEYEFKAGSSAIQKDIVSLKPVTWNIITPADPDNQAQKAEIRVTAKEEGNPTPVVWVDSLKFRTIKRARLEVNATILGSSGRVSLSPNQKFQVVAVVKNDKGEAGVKGEAQLRLNLTTATNCYLDPTDTTQALIQPFTIDSAVTWNVFAPNLPTTEAPIIVSIYKTPFDENDSEKPATVLVNRDTILVETQEGGQVLNTLFVDSPAGAIDLRLSTLQEFQVTADVSSNGLKDIQSTLLLPPTLDFSFGPNERAVKPVDEGQSVKIAWKVRAPSAAVQQTALKVFTIGKDKNSDQIIRSDTAKVNLEIVERANLKVLAEITYPEQATDNVVSTGQEFRIEASLENSGTADYLGYYKLTLKLPIGSGYTTIDNLEQTANAHAVIRWNIKAPNSSKPAANIEIFVPTTGKPYDENEELGKPAYFASGNERALVQITTIEKTVSFYTLPNRTPNTVARGERNVSLLGLEIVNSELDQKSNEIVFKGINVSIKDKDGNPLEPGDVISRIAAVKYDDHSFVYGEVSDFSSQSVIPISFSIPDTVWTAQPDSVDLIVDIAPQASVKNFGIAIDSASSITVEEVHTPKRPTVKDQAGNEGAAFQIESDFVVLMADNLKDSFGNYPNPFGSSARPTTTIAYYLKEDTDVDIKIYTLLGELVWSRSYKASEPQGKKGSHDGRTAISWDARNDKGHKVLNGVYVAYIKTGFGESATTKIAVLK